MILLFDNSSCHQSLKVIAEKFQEETCDGDREEEQPNLKSCAEIAHRENRRHIVVFLLLPKGRIVLNVFVHYPRLQQLND